MHRNGEGAIQDSGESIQDHSNCLQLCLFTNLREVDGSLTKATQLNIWRQPPPMGLLCLFASCCNMTYSVEMLLCLLKSVFKRSRSSQTVRSWLPLAHVHRDFTLQKETLHHPTPSTWCNKALPSQSLSTLSTSTGHLRRPRPPSTVTLRGNS